MRTSNEAESSPTHSRIARLVGPGGHSCIILSVLQERLRNNSVDIRIPLLTCLHALGIRKLSSVHGPLCEDRAYLDTVRRSHGSRLPNASDGPQSRHPRKNKCTRGGLPLLFRRVQPYLFAYNRLQISSVLTLVVGGDHIPQNMMRPAQAFLSQHPPVQHLLQRTRPQCTPLSHRSQ